MTSADRRAREKAETERRILEAARELFVRHGYEAVTIRRIADAIEYTSAALYAHFKSKDEIIRRICREDFDAFGSAFAALAGIADPVERIRAAGLGYIRFALEHPNQFRLMFMTRPPETGKDALADAKDDPHRDGYAFLREAVRAAIEAGRLREELADVELLTQVLWAGVHGTAALELTMGADRWIPWASVARRAELVVDTLTRGIVRGDAGASP